MLVPPLVALAAIVTWFRAPQFRRDGTLRGVLIVSVGLAALEVLLVLLIAGFLLLLSLSGGVEDF